MSAQTPFAEPPSLLHVVLRNAERYADKIAFDYCRYAPGGEEHSQISYRELDVKARATAAVLQEQGAVGERVLVLCPAGLDFLVGFFGCLYAGAVAVPVHPPVRDRVIGRVSSIIANVRARFVLTTTEVQAKVKSVVDGLAEGSSLQWYAVDAVNPEAAIDWTAPDVDASATAFLQYTSGSTNTPKGVMVTHRNLLCNLETIRRATGWVDSYVAVSWLPPHHDMGLISMILGTISFGGSCFLMPPEAFIERPMRWLEALSRYGGTITAAPNFAYDLCVERSSAQERAALDLSKWLLAVCAAEPIRAATLNRFAEAFGPSGFQPEAFKPAYGLAEATLLASGQGDWIVPLVRHLNPEALREHRVVGVEPAHPSAFTLVGCGPALYGVEVAIVDPETLRPCGDDEVGEIWLAGGAVAQGYWGEPSTTEQTFSAHLADSGRGPFLRTGDLGFLLDGELFVTGRLKDLIIIRGLNYYAEDIEATVQDSHSALLRGRGAAFSVTPPAAETERLVVVQEVDRERIRGADAQQVITAIRTGITEHHRIPAHAVVLVEPLRIPTTSSGKIRRNACRQRFLDGAFEVFAQWHSPTAQHPPHHAAMPVQTASTAEQTAQSAGRSAAEIAAWLVVHLAQELDLPAAQIDPSLPFAHFGLDSIRAIRLTSAMGVWLGCELSPTLTLEHPTIELLSRYLAEHRGDDLTATEEVETIVAGTAGPVEPVAVIGIGCRFPGADGPFAFWELLRDGVGAVTDIPPGRRGTEPADAAADLRGGFLQQVDLFDADFFGCSPQEAARMGPQQRLLLEVAWEALEDAGQVPDRLAGSRTGVFIGTSGSNCDNRTDRTAADRLSCTFDFRGPSMAIDAGGSSALVAVHQACRSLHDEESTLALAGGVNIIASPPIAGARTDGCVAGEGAAIVILKPLSRALADGDPIHAVIRGSAINHSGRTNGLRAPGRESPEAILTGAYRRAGLSPGMVQYVEADDTATALADPVRAAVLGTILAQGRAPRSRCLIGSATANIGHLGPAAGAAGLVKVVLALRHRVIPPNPPAAQDEHHLSLDGLPVRIAHESIPWPAGRAVAGVSSLGVDGVNAHVVLTEAPQVRTPEPDNDTEPRRAELLPLSARSPEALAELAGRYRTALESGIPADDLCYTAGVRRGHYEYRLAVTGHSGAQLCESLTAYRAGVPQYGLSAGHCFADQRPRLVFMFSGPASQWFGMGRQLYDEEPAFREALATCDAAARPHLAASPLTQLLDGGAGSQSGLDEVVMAEVGLFAVQVALCALWRSWGVTPHAVIGHGSGEVAAAHVAGALSLDDAARVVCRRASMTRRASAAGKKDMAPHDLHADAFGRELSGIRSVPATVPIYSTLSGDRLAEGALDADYWVDNLRAPVRLSESIQRLLEAGFDTFLDISPTSVLLDAVREAAEGRGADCTLLPSLRRDAPERATMLVALGTLYAHGQPVAWERVHPKIGRYVAAPTYPWQRDRVRPDGAAAMDAAAGTAAPRALKEAEDGSSSSWLDLLDQVENVSDDDVDELLRQVLTATDGQEDGQRNG
ncbi:AMP-binding protein [Mycobacterium sp. ML4]